MSAATSAIVEARVTLKDVAARAGVSNAAVSVVLNGAKCGNTGVSKASRAHILEVAAEMGYRRNGTMSAMRRGRFGCVALLLSTEVSRSYLPPPLLDAIHDALAERNLHLTLSRMPDRDLTDAARMPKILREWMADGLIIDYTHFTPPQLGDLIEKHRLPAVWLNTDRAFDAVRPDDYQAGRDAARHLKKLGHRRLAYLDFNHSAEEVLPDEANHYSVRARYEGVHDEWTKSGLPFGEIFGCRDYWQRVQAVRALLESASPPTAIVSYGGVGLEATLMAALQLGLQVPTDLSLMGFGDEENGFLGHAVTMMQIPLAAMGREAVALLLQKIEASQTAFPTVVVPFVLQKGSTCARLKTS